MITGCRLSLLETRQWPAGIYTKIIVLDWLLMVCEHYKQHRETYYMAMNIYDRYMDTSFNIEKEQLQLIGTTCLLIASKIEEDCPTKIEELARVTDGVCSTQSIIDAELNICKALNWRLSKHITVNIWMNTYLQSAYSTLEFIQAMEVLDLSMLNICSRQFPSSILAAWQQHSGLFPTSANNT